jgi:uncharacterized phage-associated protein
MFKNLFSEKKAAQAAAYFLHRQGGPMSVLKLTKLLYLAERLSYERFGEPLIGDRPVSMPHGPVLSSTLDLMNGMLTSAEGGWESWVSDRDSHLLALKNAAARIPADLLELSEADIGLLEETWERFGGMDQWKLRDWTHQNCPEWRDPEGSSLPIRPDDLFEALNFSPDQREAVLARLRENDGINATFAASKS